MIKGYKEKYRYYGNKSVKTCLVELTADNREKLIFSRDIGSGKYEFGGCLKTKGLAEKMGIYAEDIQDDGSVLFLSIMNRNKRTLYQKYKRAMVLKDVYMWIVKSLDVNYPNMPVSNYSYMADTDNVEDVCKMIEAFGTGITGFHMIEVFVRITNS